LLAGEVLANARKGSDCLVADEDILAFGEYSERLQKDLGVWGAADEFDKEAELFRENRENFTVKIIILSKKWDKAITGVVRPKSGRDEPDMTGGEKALLDCRGFDLAYEELEN
jgi:hypothetical protein